MPGESVNALAEYVRSRRLRAALSQEELAERADVTVDTIGALERGLRRRLFPHTARALADALQFSDDERTEFFELAHGRASGRSAPDAPAQPSPAAPNSPEPARPSPNLPTPLSRLIGREAELAQILERLPGLRLLTLTGTGGMGKTRLALELSQRLRSHYRDGVWFVELAPLTDASLVLSAIAIAVGVRESPGRPLTTTLTEALRERDLLLVLDNCEQVLDAAADIAALLKGCPGLTVLATSRAPLRVSGEQEFLLPPLRTPGESTGDAIESVGQYPAVQLFVERANAVKADFALTPENAAAVAAICARLDGLPLAIELAAARSKLFTPQALLARLARRLPLLTGGAQDLPSRQRTLRAAIAWSYDLLSEPEQALFRRLGVFVGGFTLAAAAAVCTEGSADSLDLLDALALLVDRSLLQQVANEEDEPGADSAAEPEPRFAMFETLREFALEQLELREELERWSNRHLDYFLDLIEREELNLHESMAVTKVWSTRRRLSVEHGNFRAALGWSAGRKRNEENLRLAGSMVALWAPSLNSPVARRWLDQSAGPLREAQQWLERALAMEPVRADAQRAKALYGLGRVLYFQWAEWDEHMAELDYAIRTFNESLSIYRQLNEKRGIVLCLGGLGWAHYERLQPAEAITAFEEQLMFSRELDLSTEAGFALTGLGRIAMAEGDSAAAGPALEEGLAFQRSAGNQLGAAAALDALGLYCQSQHEYDRAMNCFEEAVALRRVAGAESALPPALQRLGVLVAARGDLAGGARLLRESLELSQRMGGHPSDSAIGLLSLGAIAGSLGRPELGARMIGAGEAIFEATELLIPAAFSGLNRRTVANVRKALGDEAFEAAFAAGQARPRQDAIAEALQFSAEAARPAD